MRIKRGVQANKRRKKVLKHTKGYLWSRKTKYRLAKEAVTHAWSHAYIGRKAKKRDFRRLWQIKINYACRKQGISYSRFINCLKKNKIELDRKILSQLVETRPDLFEKIVESAKK